MTVSEVRWAERLVVQVLTLGGKQEQAVWGEGKGGVAGLLRDA